MVSIFLFLGCLEQVTGEDVPLDPRFASQGAADGEGGAPTTGGGAGAQPAASEGQPTPAPPAGDGKPTGPNPMGEAPYGDVSGEKFTLSGTVIATDPSPVRIDVCEPDVGAQGGIKRVGAVNLGSGPGAFTIQVPTEVETLILQAFQDPQKDGPSEQDPYAEVTLQLNGSAPAPIELRLEVGARGRASGSPQPAAGAGGDSLSFPDGPKVALSGQVLGATSPNVVIDVFRLDAASGAGRTYVGKIRPVNGVFSADFPVDYGAVELEAYQDLTGDSRTSDDIAAPYSLNPVSIGSVPVPDIKIQFP